MRGYVVYKKPVSRTYEIFDTEGSKLDTVVTEIPLKATEIAKAYNVAKVFINCINIEYDRYAMPVESFLKNATKINLKK